MTHEDMARELQAAGWRVQPPLTQENCKHERRMGSGSTREDGSGHMEWSCPDCGKHERIEFPSRTWRVKDYADGWIYYLTEAEARASAEAQNGALVEPAPDASARRKGLSLREVTQGKTS